MGAGVFVQHCSSISQLLPMFTLLPRSISLLNIVQSFLGHFYLGASLFRPLLPIFTSINNNKSIIPY